MLDQIFDAINLGIIILDKEFRIHRWNRWMQIHSGLSEREVKGKSLFEIFPELDNVRFRRNCKSVLKFGNYAFLSQKLHGYLFPFKSKSYICSEFEYMQQSCTIGPLRDENNEINYLFIYIQDVTEIAAYERMLKEMNVRDALTGIYNRRFLENKLMEEFRRYRRYGSRFSLIMFDIDHFKRVNDTYGHQCGDFVLRSISSRISSIIRNVDYLARYGGEEFCCILPETELAPAMVVAERFRKEIMNQECIYNENIIKVTISLGVSTVDEKTASYEDVLKLADRSLYLAKESGRNTVVSIQYKPTPLPS
jgi:diguanylate cyclase (GGDEF)-like protein